VVIVGREGTREYSGSDPQTTNNRMELTAAIEGLRKLPAGARVKLRSDSQYMIKSINFGWKRNANVDLWKDLDIEIARRRVSFEWVRGHAGDPLNERADRLALQAAKDAADSKRAPTRAAPAPLQPSPPVSISRQAAGAAPSMPRELPPEAEVSTPIESPPAEETLPPGEIEAEEEAAMLETLRPFLKTGETTRRCACCGEYFIAPERYSAEYCALARCQLERRSR
jgi:ribonuclease HI